MKRTLLSLVFCAISLPAFALPTFGITADMRPGDFSDAEVRLTPEGMEVWVVTPPAPMSAYEFYMVTYGSNGRICNVRGVSKALTDPQGRNVRYEMLLQAERVTSLSGAPRQIDEAEFGYLDTPWNQAVLEGKRRYLFLWDTVRGNRFLDEDVSTMIMSAAAYENGQVYFNTWAQFEDNCD